MENLDKVEQEKIKKSYFNLLALFLSEPSVASRYARCFIKWSVQLQISEEDVVKLGKDLVELKYKAPETDDEKLKAVFHLVYMIYLDKIMEDDELEVAMKYAEKLGLNPDVVANLFQSIATAEDISPETLESEVLGFMRQNK
jgi:hypothetical protein